MKRFLLGLLVGLSLLSGAQAQDDFVVRDLRVEGLLRISDGTVFNYLPVNIGDTIDAQRVAESIRALYGTRLFESIELRRDGDTLVIVVEERPTIRNLTITGNQQIEEDDLRTSLRSAGLAEGRSFEQSLVDRTEQELRRTYFANGKYGVQITTDVVEAPNNQIDLSIRLAEGDVSKIRQINIVGNTVFDDDELLGRFELDTDVFWPMSIFSKKDLYSAQKFEGDLEALESHYRDRGYATFNVASVQVAISPDKSDVYLTVNVEEGDVYTVSDVKLAGDMVVPEEELMFFVFQKPGTIYAQRLVTQTEEWISRRLGLDGYAFAEITPIPEFDEEAKTVALTFFIQPNSRTYVRRISFNGVEKTNDEVFRREMRQMEGGWVSNAALERSKQRIERLPYVEAVDMQTIPVSGETDLVDVEFDIKQRQSGTFSAGVGFSDSQGLLLNGGFTESNFFGTGKRVATNLNIGSFTKFVSFSITNPYATKHGISRQVALTYRANDQLVADASQFSINELNASLIYSFPLSENSSLSIGGTLANTELLTSTFTPVEYENWVRFNGNTFFRAGSIIDQNGNQVPLLGSTFTNFAGIVGWTRDTRNRSIFATRGSRQTLSLEAALGDVEYYIARYRYGAYVPVFGNFTLRFRGDLATSAGVGDTLWQPPTKNFFAGGAQSVRGYRRNLLSPLDSVGNPFGGNLLLTNSVELILPTPEKLAGAAQMSIFYDIGGAFWEGDQRIFIPVDAFGVPTGQPPTFNPDFWRFDVKNLYSSVGFSMVWLSPLGAIQLSYGIPFDAVDTIGGIPIRDQEEQIQFSVNSPF